MTRDELLDEGFEKALTFDGKYMQKKACYQYGYLDGAEPREKRIEKLKKGYKEIRVKLVEQKYDYATRIDDVLDFIDELLEE